MQNMKEIEKAILNMDAAQLALVARALHEACNTNEMEMSGVSSAQAARFEDCADIADTLARKLKAIAK
jgi:hypothetical protein